MPAAPRRIALAAVLLAGALPSVAVAQTAGDDQYQDPFGGSATPAPPQPAPSAPAAPPAAAPPPAAPPAAAPATGAPPQASAAARSPAQLPYTGADAGLVALAGAALLGSGAFMRVRLRERA
jgi:LPXTG-motif cell wall-anchored protein